jgi:hypothetical protein
MIGLAGMNKYNKIGLSLLFSCYLGLASALVEDFSPKQQATEYHLKQAYYKLERQEYAYAWGEFAYLLCKDPVNHEILEQMVEISAFIDRSVELREYFVSALQNKPDDPKIKELFRKFQAQSKK